MFEILFAYLVELSVLRARGCVGDGGVTGHRLDLAPQAGARYLLDIVENTCSVPSALPTFVVGCMTAAV